MSKTTGSEPGDPRAISRSWIALPHIGISMSGWVWVVKALGPWSNRETLLLFFHAGSASSGYADQVLPPPIYRTNTFILQWTLYAMPPQHEENKCTKHIELTNIPSIVALEVCVSSRRLSCHVSVTMTRNRKRCRIGDKSIRAHQNQS